MITKFFWLSGKRCPKCEDYLWTNDYDEEIPLSVSGKNNVKKPRRFFYCESCNAYFDEHLQEIRKKNFLSLIFKKFFL